MTLSLELLAAIDPRTQAIWRELEAQSRAPYFLSWGWIDTWLACVPREDHPQLAVLAQQGEPVAACFLGQHRTSRHHLLPTRAMFLNATGIARYDELTIEHNGLLRTSSAATLEALVDLLPPDCDELVLPALEPSELVDVCGPHVEIDRIVTAPYVDLSKVRASGYLPLLNAETRAQIRRARRGAGELEIEIAGDAQHARDIYDELVALHTAGWRARGQPGAFADPWFDHFHRRLIAARFAAGEIALVRVRAKDHTLGCLYNFVYRGVVSFYQSGLAHESDARIKPGYLCHVAAIEHAAGAGRLVYDFLGGEGRYKRSLATDETQLVWARIQRPHARFTVENWLRQHSARR